MKTAKKVLGIVVDVLIVLVFVLSICIIIMNATYKKEDGYSKLFGCTFFTVETDSMEPTLKVGDMIIGKVVDANTVINEGDIISFKEYKSSVNKIVINTHRVIYINELKDEFEQGTGEYTYVTQGDNVGIPDVTDKTINDIVSVYKFRLPGAGAVINFLKSTLGFLLCLVLPILIVIGYQIYKLIVMYMASKKEEMIAQVTDNTSDEVKDAIIQEYLARQAAQQQAAQENSETPPPETGADDK
ncbi:MAG: signal peptidase I [Clostridia bacterium]|nr:signal peptidase I [Clostridia bacterium]